MPPPQGLFDMFPLSLFAILAFLVPGLVVKAIVDGINHEKNLLTCTIAGLCNAILFLVLLWVFFW